MVFYLSFHFYFFILVIFIFGGGERIQEKRERNSDERNIDQ